MARPVKHDGGLYKRTGSKIWWMRYRDKDGNRQRESTLPKTGAKRRDASESDCKPGTTTHCRRCAAGRISHLGSGRLFTWKISPAPRSARRRHTRLTSALKHLRGIFENTTLASVNADDIETYLRRRLKQRVQVKAKNGFVQKGILKAKTVHQELRMVRRMLNVAVRKKFLFANPCAGVEFPARVEGLFRPHYMTWSEQQKIEFSAPEYLRNVIRIITETGLRIYKELTPMKKDQLDLENRTVWISDSKTPSGIAEVPLTEIAADAFRHQLALSGPSPYLFPSDVTGDGIRRRLKPFGMRHCAGQEFDIFVSTIFAPHTRPGSVPGALRTSG